MTDHARMRAAALARLKGEIPSRRVLVANARTRRAFRAEIFASFAREGADSWDPYRVRAEAPVALDVWPGVKVQLEPDGCIFRLRHKGGVVLVEWLPEEGAAYDRDAFLASHVVPFAAARGQGAAAFIARTLSRGG